MTFKSPVVVGCREEMTAVSTAKGFVTGEDCPAWHPAGTPISELLDFCQTCSAKEEYLASITIAKKNKDGSEEILYGGPDDVPLKKTKKKFPGKKKKAKKKLPGRKK